jgi:cytochrome c
MQSKTLMTSALVGLMALGLVACGGSDSGKTAATPAATTPAATTPAETTPAPTPEPTPAAQTETATPAPTETAAPAETVPAAAPAGGDAASAYAALTGDPEKGRRIFTQCQACHNVAEGKNGAGPSLYKIVGRTAGQVAGFKYSKANSESGIVWTEEVMFEYLENPRKYLPGTNMSFAGLSKPQDRADVIAYLKQAGE